MPHPRVASLHIYPVKGCKGIDLDAAWFERTGLAYDRNWMIVKEERGRFVTQRQQPKLALIKTSLPLDAVAAPSRDPPEGAVLTLEAPGMDKLQVPLAATGPFREVSCWEFAGPAYDQGDEAAEWLTRYLEQPARLVRYAGGLSDKLIEEDPSRRPTDAKWAADQEVAFADGYPALIVSEGLLNDLNNRLQAPLAMNRFRPNIVITNCSPAAEDKWEEFEIGQSVLVEAVKPCDRCKVTCTNQETAEVGDEPLKTLRSFRSSAALNWDMPKSSVFFGWNIVPRKQGVIKVYDDVQVLRYRSKPVTNPSKAKLAARSAQPQTAQAQYAQAVAQRKVESQADMIRGGLLAAFQGAAAAVAIAGILFCLMYSLIKATPQEVVFWEPT